MFKSTNFVLFNFSQYVSYLAKFQFFTFWIMIPVHHFQPLLFREQICWIFQTLGPAFTRLSPRLPNLQMGWKRGDRRGRGRPLSDVVPPADVQSVLRPKIRPTTSAGFHGGRSPRGVEVLAAVLRPQKDSDRHRLQRLRGGGHQVQTKSVQFVPLEHWWSGERDSVRLTMTFLCQYFLQDPLIGACIGFHVKYSNLCLLLITVLFLQ